MNTTADTVNQTAGSLVGIVVACMLGLMFVVSCIASVVKAVRDRQDIKTRLASKKSGTSIENGGSEEGTKKVKSNILIIKDVEREQRLKKDFALPADSSLATQQTSCRTENTTVAEMSPQADDSMFTESMEPSLVLEMSSTSLVDNSSFTKTYADAQSMTESRRSSSGSDDTIAGKSKESGDKNVSQNNLQYVVEDDEILDDGGGTRAEAWCAEVSAHSPTFHGYAKKKKTSSHYQAPTDPAVYTVAYNPRRNSYAAAISANPDWLDHATVRRDSVEPGHPVTSTPRALRSRDHARVHSKRRNGAENPAYNAVEDSITMR